MPHINELPHRDVQRTDTLSLYTFVKYDPLARRATTPVMVGRYLVHREPLWGSVHTLYKIMDGTEVARAQISHPSEGDCATALSAHRTARRIAGRMTAKVRPIKKGWKAKPMTVKEAA